MTPALRVFDLMHSATSSSNSFYHNYCLPLLTTFSKYVSQGMFYRKPDLATIINTLAVIDVSRASAGTKSNHIPVVLTSNACKELSVTPCLLTHITSRCRLAIHVRCMINMPSKLSPGSLAMNQWGLAQWFLEMRQDFMYMYDDTQNRSQDTICFLLY